jgi:hypothetical protein
MMKRLFVVALAAAPLLVSPALEIPSARAHGDAEWIQQSKQFGWCCGKDDCAVVPTTAVKTGGAGFELGPTKEIVPYKEALPSIDGQYWRCQLPTGKLRCFFAPINAF